MEYSEILIILAIIFCILFIISSFFLERRLIASVKELRLKLNEVIETVNNIIDEMENNNEQRN